MLNVMELKPRKRRVLTEADKAARLLGTAIQVEQMARTAGEIIPRPVEYCIRCHFCHQNHVSPYWDEIEEGIMACRDVAPQWKQARLADWQPLEIIQTEWMPESQV